MARRQITLGILGLALAGAIAGGIFAWRNGLVSIKPQELLLRLPTQDAVVAGADFAALRHAGYLRILANSKAAVEPEYTSFVRDTGFDYQRDLDSVLVSFAPDGTFFLVAGTFDWPRLELYARAQNGTCEKHLCRVAGSTPQRRISFFPLKHNVLAMAVAPDEKAALRLEHAGPQQDIDIPSAPLWLSLSSGAIRHSTLTGNTRLLASALANANRVTLTVGPADGNLEAHLEALCGDPEQAGALTTQLRLLTSLLREAAQRQTAGKDDFAALLTAGTFEQSGTRVGGRWVIQRSLLANLMAGM